MPDPSKTVNEDPVALVTGGSSGLGWHIAETFSRQGYRVVIVGRSSQRLEDAAAQIQTSTNQTVQTFAVDLCVDDGASELARWIASEMGRLDVLVNVVGASDRGLALDLTADRLQELIQFNVLTMLNCSRAMLPLLKESRGSIVNIGSLAGKVGARYLGGYNAAKHSLAGLTQQMRLELAEQKIHVGLISPGPIQRDDAGKRYNERVDSSVPEKAAAPGGGTKVKGLPPERVAKAVVKCVQKRKPDVILPGYLRILITVGHAFPRLGDWLLLKLT